MKTCRFCLEKTAEMYIFDSRKTLFPKFLSYCKVEMYKNDGLPQHVCASCVEKLKEVVRFINQCKENDRILRSSLDVNYSSVIKTEKREIEEVPAEYNEVPMEFKEEKIDLHLLNEFDINDFEYDEARDTFCDETDSIEICDDRNIKGDTKKKRDTLDDKCVSQLCPVCGKHYIKASYFREHLKSHGAKDLMCDECPKAFSTKSSLTSHKLSHSSVRKYKCEYCGKMFKTSHHANMHMEYIHRKSKPLPCAVCGKIFYSPQSLKTHAVVHTQERKFQCDKCDKAFSSKIWLKSHLRVHTGERPYACRFCDSKFSILQSLKEHERLHTGEKPYKCPVCLKGFAQKGNMKSHFKYNHKGMDFKTTVLKARLDQS